MVSIGYTIMGEQAGPQQLVADAIRAEQAGFDFIAASDHHEPWLKEQGHSPYVWSVLGAVAHATDRIELMTYVTCPTMRYHPAVVAQKAATVQLLANGRFTLGVGSGEHLNEHITGADWPPFDVRHEMLDEALQIIRAMFDGETLTFRGNHLQTQAARLWDLPPQPPKIAVAASGAESCELAGARGDALIAVQPERSIVAAFDAAGGIDKPRIGQAAIAYDRDPNAAANRAHQQFRWFSTGWPVMSELPGPKHFDAASESVRQDDVTAQIPCGDDVDAVVQSVRRFIDAGFSHVALVQIGAEQQSQFFDWAEAELLAELRTL